VNGLIYPGYCSKNEIDNLLNAHPDEPADIEKDSMWHLKQCTRNITTTNGHGQNRSWRSIGEKQLGVKQKTDIVDLVESWKEIVVKLDQLILQ